MAIQSFTDTSLALFFTDGTLKKRWGWRNVYKIVRRKLDLLDYAHVLEDLKSPPGNRLELLKGSLKGRYSIRVNDQWRIVFVWTDYGPTDVEVIDYH